MKIGIKIIFILMVIIIPSFCYAQDSYNFLNTEPPKDNYSSNKNTPLDDALKRLTKPMYSEKIDINEELKILEEIEKKIEEELKEKKPQSKQKETNGEKVSGDDYESFLKELQKEELLEEKVKTKQQNFVQKLQGDKINVVIEINKYFTEDKLCPVDLHDCLSIALKNNFGIRIFSTRTTQGLWNYKNTFAAFLPDIGIDTNVRRLNGEFIVGGVAPLNINESVFWSLFRFDWTLYQGGARFHRKNAEKSRYYSTVKNLEFQKQLVLRDTAISYYNLLGIKLGIEILTRNLRETKAQLKLTTQNFEAGIGTKFDVLRAKAEVAQAEQRLISSYNSFRLEQANLSNILGIGVFTSIMPVETDVKKKKLMDKELTMKDISKLSIKARPDLNSIRFNIRALLNDKKRIFSGFLPTLNSFWRSGFAGTSEDGHGPSNAFGLGLDIPFGTNCGTEEYTRLKQIDARITEEKLTLQNASRIIQQDIVRSYYSSKTAEERAEAAKEEVIAADESLRLAFLRLEAGLGIYVDVLQSQTAKTDAKINLIRAIIDHNIAQINLLFDSGTISSGNILKDYDKCLSQKYIPPTKEEIEKAKESQDEVKTPESSQPIDFKPEQP